MKYATATLLVALLGVVAATPAKMRRELPQEQSHNKYLTSVRKSLNLDNPDGIVDPIFGLLGNAAAAEGAGKIKNLDCLHQATADRAFTNAKKAGDVQAQVDALIYATLERNTAKVGLKSALCNETAVNKEIQGLSQHQDPASEGAAAGNKAIVLLLAQRIKAIGGNPTEALQSGTFKQGDRNDSTGAGNSCDDKGDKEGCIFTKKLLVNDATEEEIQAAVAGGGSGAGGNKTSNGNQFSGSKVNKEEKGSDSKLSGANSDDPKKGPSGAATNSTAAGSNIQTFTGSLGGLPPAVIKSSGNRPFSVNGNTFLKAGAALQRSCSIQHNACANAANSKTIAGGEVQCEDQEKKCNDAAKASAAAAARKTKRQAARGFNFGSCSNPTIKFAAGPDGRKESYFQAVNTDDFNHGPAVSINAISGSICQQLQYKCKAGADTLTACMTAKASASNLTGQEAADAFNRVLGV